MLSDASENADTSEVWVHTSDVNACEWVENVKLGVVAASAQSKYIELDHPNVELGRINSTRHTLKSIEVCSISSVITNSLNWLVELLRKLLVVLGNRLYCKIERADPGNLWTLVPL